MNFRAQNEPDLETLRDRAQQDVRDLRQRLDRLDPDAIELVLSGARSHYAWKDIPVSDAQIEEIYDIVKMGSTSMNSCPARFVFLRSAKSRKRLAPALKPANLDKMMGAPLTVIVAYDPEFWRKLPFLFPHDDRRGHFSDNPEHAETTAFRNSTLQGGYLMTAARAIGLDVGAMSGFSNAAVDAEFFAGTTWKSNFLCNIGHADESALFQRLPRFAFEDVCKIL